MEASILILFIALQAGFSRLDSFIEHRFAARVKGKHWVVWLVHPNVLKGGHDFVIFIVAELPKAFGH
jgi:hypothetical protein